MPDGKIERVGKIIGGVATASIVVAQYLLLSRGATKPVHFAVYLLGQAWFELCIVVAATVLYLICKKIVAYYRAVAHTYSWRTSLALLLRPAGLALIALSVAFLLITIDHLVYIARARQYFWTEMAREAYVRHYTEMIDGMSEVGRITDALNLTNMVLDNLGSNSEAASLSRRHWQLAASQKRSELVGAVEAGGSWNPITDRILYFRLVEAVRVNPQNYNAADLLKARSSALGQFLSKDVQALCESEGRVANIKSRAVSYQELEARWSEFGTSRSCPSEALHALKDAWLWDEAECLLAVSDWTRRPFDFNRRWLGEPRCAGLAMPHKGGSEHSAGTEVEDENSEEDQNDETAWYDVDFGETTGVIRRQAVRLLKRFGLFKDDAEDADSTPVAPSTDQADDTPLDSPENDDNAGTLVSPETEAGEPVAFARHGNTVDLVDANGVFIHFAPGGMAAKRYSFPVVTGVSEGMTSSERAKRMVAYTQFIGALNGTGEKLSDKISEVDLSDTSDICALIATPTRDINVHFGDKDYVARFRSFEEHFAEWLNQYPKLASADMRYENQVVLDIENGSDDPPAK